MNGEFREWNCLSLLYKLHRYEMLGYEPEQIEDFDHHYREKCNEVTRLKQELENLKKGNSGNGQGIFNR